ncbi:hypothetical protein DPMN_015414 [Dreissena polymorpha]|uniref:Uncharacterized protein n=1 Tax=Dreissena polymorpha TaxID=45954 RepID=A0A9D4N945_DREPO|nr:hypothetical protein DPMN_015414 [Dreissena polymorpha]
MNSEHPGSHVFKQTGIIFVHIKGIITANALTKFHEDWTINVTFKEKHPPPPSGHIFQPPGTTINVASIVLTRKNDPPPDGHVFQPTGTILNSSKISYWTINVAPRGKNALPPGGHVFHATRTIFKLFHDDRTINGASRVKNATPPLSDINVASIVFTRKNTLPWF